MADCGAGYVAFGTELFRCEVSDQANILSAGGAAAEGDVPVPRRYWWLRRLAVAGGCFVVFLILLRLAWGWEANRRLAAEIARYRSAGQPVYAREFDAVLDAVPDEENAALLYEKAMAGVVPAAASGLTVNDFYAPSRPELLVESAADAREIVGANQMTLSLVREARGLPQVAWSARLEGTSVTGPQTMGSGQRSLAKMLWLSSTLERLAGDHAVAFETVADVIALGEAIGAHATLVANLVSGSTQGIGYSLIEDMTGGLYIEPLSQPSPMRLRPVSRAAMEKLITRLLEESTVRQAAMNSRYGERAYYLDMLEAIEHGEIVAVLGLRAGIASARDRIAGVALQPAYTLDALEVIQLITNASEALAEEGWPEADARIPAAEPLRPSLLGSITSPISTSPYGSPRDSIRRSIEIHFEFLAKRRMAATALAVLLYEADHGRRPATLAELAPEYLPRVPVDPFSPDGAGIRYRPDIARPLLYGVGSDGVDDGGLSRGEAIERQIDTHDIPFGLDGRKELWRDISASRPSAEAVDHDQDPQDSEREQDEEQATEGDPE